MKKIFRLKKIRLWFSALTLSQKTSFFFGLCVLSIISTAILVHLSAFMVRETRKNNEIVQEQKLWIGQHKQIEKDISDFPLRYADRYDKDPTPSSTLLKSNMLSILSEVSMNNSIVRTDREEIGSFVINRFDVRINNISITNLLEVTERIMGLNSNIAISEIKIKAQNNGMLNAYAIVSILSKPRIQESEKQKVG